MKLAIMQPYLFPHISYFHLLDSVDTFVFYDDVNFINSGWVNRNKIIVNQNTHLFTVPTNWTQNKKINQVEVTHQYDKWKTKFFKTLKHSYGKQKYFADGMEIVEKTFNNQEKISEICKLSIKNVLEYLEVEKNIIDSSKIFNNQELKSSNRIKDICKKINADTYINSIGGKSLYTKKDFLNDSIDLFFIKSEECLNHISIIDIIMKNGKGTREYLTKYKLE